MKGSRSQINGNAIRRVQYKFIVSEFTPIVKKIFSIARYLLALNYF